DADLGNDLAQGVGVLAFGDSDANDMGAGGGETVDLGDAFVDVVGVAGGHGLDDDGGGAAGVGRGVGRGVGVAVCGSAATDADDADALVAEGDLTGWPAWIHASMVAGGWGPPLRGGAGRFPHSGQTAEGSRPLRE